jgi:transcriptional regulator with XRE-family HTH domain
MMSDEAQTKILRSARLSEKTAVKELNPIGKRLEWVRTRLELSQKAVCDASGIPRSSYCGREAGVRAVLVEEYLVLAAVFNSFWTKKFKTGFPLYNGEEVKKITFEWLISGRNDLDANAEALIEEYKIQLAEIERRFYEHEAELLRQLDMFARGDG